MSNDNEKDWAATLVDATNNLSRGSMIFVTKQAEGKDLVGAEIGVLEGWNAANLLTYLPGLKKLYLIDPYKGELRYWKEISKKKLARFGKYKSWIYKEFGHCDKRNIRELLDFVYIDGDHSYNSVQIDLQQAAKFVKPHGVICGHDFQMDTVSQAVTEYCKANDFLLEVWGGEWWFVNYPMVDAKMLLDINRAPDIFTEIPGMPVTEE